jgi:hypothetical protein
MPQGAVYFRHFCVLKDDNFSTNMFVMMPDDFRRHSPENVTSSCDPLETLPRYLIIIVQK